LAIWSGAPAFRRIYTALVLLSEEASFIVGAALFVDGDCTTTMPGNA
jgi:hypothetical protein